MAIREKVGLEAEYLLINDKGERVIPPSGWDHDDFPLLGEIRGQEGKSVAETVTNFKAAEMALIEKLHKGYVMQYTEVAQIKLALYKKANSQVDWEAKNRNQSQIKNIYGIDIEEFSDQVVAKNKIQGVRVSCGLHIHFSCAEMIHYEYEEDQYEQIVLPLGLDSGLVARRHYDNEGKSPIDFSNGQLVAKELLTACLYLYRRKGYEKKFEKKIYASRLNKPAIEYIVKAMDEAFFERFAPAKADRTKYRQPGFYELKPYGFEYRSLPANADSIDALPEITAKAFELLGEINEF